MNFNRYLWSNYLKAGGKETVAKFDKFLSGDFEGYTDFVDALMRNYCPDEFTIKYCKQGIQYQFDNVELVPNVPDNEKADSPDETDQIETEQKNSEQDVSEEEWIEEILSELRRPYDYYIENGAPARGAFFNTVNGIGGITTMIAYDDPDNFIPYYFSGTFNVVERILNYLGIERPRVPGKTKYVERLNYYGTLCILLNDFREEAELSPSELWALIYDYVPQVTGGTDYIVKQEKLPEPHNVFVFGCGPGAEFVNPSFDHVVSFQGNPDMRPGDIGVLYRWASNSKKVQGSYYDSIWRAVSEGFYDPLAIHDRNVFYAHPVEIPRVTIADLKADPIFSETKLVRSKMTQMDGARMTNHEYLHLLEMAAQKGEVPENAPTVQDYVGMPDVQIELERDVEEQLLEPFLARLGWSVESQGGERNDFVRQLELSSGRSTHIYPDYVLNYDSSTQHGEIVFEAKKTIKSMKQAEHDKKQARSYANIIHARAAVLVSQEGIWIAESKDDFNKLTAYKWEELQYSVAFDEVYQILGKGKIKKRR